VTISPVSFSGQDLCFPTAVFENTHRQLDTHLLFLAVVDHISSSNQNNARIDSLKAPKGVGTKDAYSYQSSWTQKESLVTQ
jgi:hypothetical protein